MNKNGFFIAFEGIDGSGKSTLAYNVGKWLQKSNIDMKRIHWKNTIFKSARFNNFLQLSVSIYKDIYSDIENQSELLHPFLNILGSSLYSLIYSQKVIPYLEKGYYILTDGWFYKRIARQLLDISIFFHLDDDTISDISDWLFLLYKFSGNPDLIFLVDVDPEICWERKRFTHTKFETGTLIGLKKTTKENFIAYQEKLKEILLSFAKKNRWIILKNHSYEDLQSSLDFIQDIITIQSKVV